MSDVRMIRSVKSLLNMPAYVYVAGFIGAAATYVLYSPTSSKSSKLSKSPTFKNSELAHFSSDLTKSGLIQFPGFRLRHRMSKR